MKIPVILIILSLVSINRSYSQNKTSWNQFFNPSKELQSKVDSIFDSMDDKSRVAQMIVTSAGELGKKDSTVYRLAKQNQIGGVVFLKGTKENHKKMIDSLNNISSSSSRLPLIFSIDAEPSLFNGRLQNTEPMMNTIDINSVEQADSIATDISKQLRDLGFHQNFAPVCDLSPNNDAIKNRSFGTDKNQVIKLSKQFIESTQNKGLIATAKHFPGHGLVSGDTHKKSVYIEGELKELSVYPPLIKAGVVSIMVAHITVKGNKKYNTNDLPATCSRTIVTDLLRKKLKFKGLIITDAMNIMKAVTVIDNAPLKASLAGCDMLLMPIDEAETIDSILKEMNTNPDYKTQVYDSVKKIIRLKLIAFNNSTSS